MTTTTYQFTWTPADGPLPLTKEDEEAGQRMLAEWEAAGGRVQYIGRSQTMSDPELFCTLLLIDPETPLK